MDSSESGIPPYVSSEAPEKIGHSSWWWLVPLVIAAAVAAWLWVAWSYNWPPFGPIQKTAPASTSGFTSTQMQQALKSLSAPTASSTSFTADQLTTATQALSATTTASSTTFSSAQIQQAIQSLDAKNNQ